MASLGGVTLPLGYDHDGHVRTVVDVGAMHELLSGNIAYDYVGDRYHWALRCPGCTSTQRDNILGVYRTKTSQAYVSPDGTTYYVLVVPNTWRESYIEDGAGTKWFTIEFEIEEATVSGAAPA